MWWGAAFGTWGELGRRWGMEKEYVDVVFLCGS